MHRVLETVASNLIDIDYVEWREAITKNNARLYRQSVRTARWDKYSHSNIEDCIVNPSYSQFLELMMDEDSAKVSAENKPFGEAFRKLGEKHRREYWAYKDEI